MLLWWGYQMVEKKFKIGLPVVVLIHYRLWQTASQTATQPRCRSYNAKASSLKMQAGYYENGNGGKRTVSGLTQFIQPTQRLHAEQQYKHIANSIIVQFVLLQFRDRLCRHWRMPAAKNVLHPWVWGIIVNRSTTCSIFNILILTLNRCWA